MFLVVAHELKVRYAFFAVEVGILTRVVLRELLAEALYLFVDRKLGLGYSTSHSRQVNLVRLCVFEQGCELFAHTAGLRDNYDARSEPVEAMHIL